MAKSREEEKESSGDGAWTPQLRPQRRKTLNYCLSPPCPVFLKPGNENGNCLIYEETLSN